MIQCLLPLFSQDELFVWILDLQMRMRKLDDEFMRARRELRYIQALPSVVDSDETLPLEQAEQLLPYFGHRRLGDIQRDMDVTGELEESVRIAGEFP